MSNELMDIPPETGNPGVAPMSQPGRVATPIAFDDDDIAVVQFDGDGLVPAIVQDATDGAVLMIGYMNESALRQTLSTGRSWFWSRSRQEYWCKGETSGDRQWVRSVHYDCDGDALLLTVDQDGDGACHTGARSCFYRAFGQAPGEAGMGNTGTAAASAPG
jgi:phosphoribosyl-AMP cyclohydrolase